MLQTGKQKIYGGKKLHLKEDGGEHIFDTQIKFNSIYTIIMYYFIYFI